MLAQLIYDYILAIGGSLGAVVVILRLRRF
jgi:hypothetical protein